jgi:uncharacterized integral membrane protein
MIRRFVGWFVLVPLCAVLVLFTLANRQPVSVRFDPFSPSGTWLPEFSVPMYLVIFGALIVGILLGGIAVWFTQGRQRKEKRHWKREAGRLERERDEALRRPAEKSDDLLIDTYDL